MRDTGHLWAITCYFNPVGYRRRLANYHAFHRYLNVPLITVELARNSTFHLSSNDADILIQLPHGDVLWQKERLLNVALERLPKRCQLVAWLDCDVIFQRRDWHHDVNRSLEKFDLVQLFREVHHLHRDARVDGSPPVAVDRCADAIAWRIAQGTVPMNIFSVQGGSQIWGYTPGHAWASRRATLESVGLYDALIMGSGDKAMVSAAFGYIDEAVRAYEMNSRQADHYRSWAQSFSKLIQQNVGSIEGTVWHLWHGQHNRRRYANRYEGFYPFEFDPYSDIGIDENGCWRWTTKKVAMHRHVSEYFTSRREDGESPV